MNRVQACSQATGLAIAIVRHPVNGRGLDRMATHALSAALLLVLAPSLHAASPSGGVVTTGAATIDQAGAHTRITQTSPNASTTPRRSATSTRTCVTSSRSRRRSTAVAHLSRLRSRGRTTSSKRVRSRAPIQRT